MQKFQIPPQQQRRPSHSHEHDGLPFRLNTDICYISFIYNLQSFQNPVSEQLRLPDRHRCQPVQTDPVL